MDRYLIAAKQPHEILHVRLVHYKVVKDEIIHPTTFDIKELVKIHNRSRKRVYASLKEAGFIRVTKK